MFRLRRAGAALVAVAAVGVLAGGVLPAVSNSTATAAPALSVGIHDGAPDDCINSLTTAESGKTAVPAAADFTTAAGKAATSFTNAYWKGLNVKTVRYTVQWDVADPVQPSESPAEVIATENQEFCFAAWLQAAHTAGVTSVEIDFAADHNFTYTDSKTHKLPTGKGGNSKAATRAIPDYDRYKTAVGDFIKAFTCSSHTGCKVGSLVPNAFSSMIAADVATITPVSIIAPWGEPDYSTGVNEMPSGIAGDTFDRGKCTFTGGAGNLKGCGPTLAANMFTYVKSDCGSKCSDVIAGDFGSGTSNFTKGSKLLNYLTTYSQHLKNPAALNWGIHPYNDVEAGEQYFDKHKGAMPGPGTATRVLSYGNALSNLNGGKPVNMWLDEISSFFCTGQGNGYPGPNVFTRQAQSAGLTYLFGNLSHASFKHSNVKVTNIYYLNFDGPQSSNAELINTADNVSGTDSSGASASCPAGPKQAPNPAYTTFKAQTNPGG